MKQGDYVIGSGDLLGIEVFDVPELSRDVRVNETGYISLPLMPAKVRAAGLTTFQLQDKLAELLADQRIGIDAASHRIPEGTAQPAHHRDRRGQEPDGDPGDSQDHAAAGAVAGRGHRG